MTLSYRRAGTKLQLWSLGPGYARFVDDRNPRHAVAVGPSTKVCCFNSTAAARRRKQQARHASGGADIRFGQVNSVIAAPSENQQVSVGQPVEINGVAWDGGYGVHRVDVSADNGASWQAAALGPDLGRFAFRAWSYRFTPKMPGKHAIMASNVIGQTQAENLIFNPAGYHNNVVRPLTIIAA